MGKGLMIMALACCLACWDGSGVCAESSADAAGEPAYTLGEIIVTGEQDVVEAVGTVREVGASEIETRGVRTLSEALQLLPGVVIRSGAEGTPRVDLRGLRSRHVVLLLDGIPLNSTFDGQFDPSVIPVENISRIKLSYGTHSVLYGDGGLAGVINIITKQGGQKVKGSVAGEAGSGSQNLGRFTLSGGKGALTFFGSGSVYDSDGYRLSDDFKPTSEEDGGLRENSDSERRNLFGNLSYKPNDRLHVGFVVDYKNGEFGLPPSTINDKKDVFANSPKYERVEDFDGISAQLSSSYDFDGPLSMRGWVFVNQQDEERSRYDDNAYNSMSDPSIKGTFHEDNTTTISGAALQTAYDLAERGKATFGLNVRQEAWEANGRIRDVEVKKNVYEFRDYSDDRDLNVYNVSLEYEVNPLDDLGIVLGGGYNWMNNPDGSNDDAGNFLFGAYYDLNPETRLRGSVARKIRFPSIRQLYEEAGGNPDLTTENSLNYELGLERELPAKSRFTATAFLMDVKDYIEKILPDDRFENNDEYRFQGFELMLESAMVDNALVRAGYTFLHAEDRSAGTEKDELQYRPKHKLTLEGQYTFPAGFTAYANMLYIANQVYYSKKAPLVEGELEDYVLFNVKLEQKLFNDFLRLYVRAENLFDVDYEESYGYPQSGRMLYAGAELRF